MSQLTPEIPFMASLWIRSGCDMKVEVSAETYQVGAHFKALIKTILVAPSRILEIFFFISPCRAVTDKGWKFRVHCTLTPIFGPLGVNPKEHKIWLCHKIASNFLKVFQILIRINMAARMRLSLTKQ